MLDWSGDRSDHHAVLAVPAIADGIVDSRHQHAADAVATAGTQSNGRAGRATASTAATAAGTADSIGQ